MAKLMTDALSAYRRIGQSHPSHLMGVHHWISGKHLDRYAAQAAHAWNHRTRDAATLMSLLARPAEPLPFRALTA